MDKTCNINGSLVTNVNQILPNIVNVSYGNLSQNLSRLNYTSDICVFNTSDNCLKTSVSLFIRKSTYNA